MAKQAASKGVSRTGNVLSALVLGVGLVLLSGTLRLQNLQAAPLDARVIQSGHSLTDPIPDVLERLIVAGGGQPITVARSTIPGSPMEWRWTHRAEFGGADARTDIASYDVLVMTERVSLANTMPYHDTLGYAARWTKHAWTKGNRGKGAETILYATWVGRNTGPGTVDENGDPDSQIAWRDRLDREYKGWLQIQSHVNASRPAGAPRMRMIPGPVLMAALFDDLQDGKVPGVRNIDAFFRDDIHLSELGAYAIGLLHYAVIYERDPRELRRIQGAPRNAKLDTYLRALVWRVVTSRPETGVPG
jgi:hypothetical protein